MRAPQLLHRLVHHLLVYPQLPEHPRRIAGTLPRRRHQQVLDADELVVQPLGLFIRKLQQPLQSGRDENLLGVRHHLGRSLQRLVQPGLHRFWIDAEFLQYALRQSALQRNQRQQHVLHVPLAVPVVADQFLRTLQCLLSLACEFFRAQYHIGHLM